MIRWKLRASSWVNRRSFACVSFITMTLYTARHHFHRGAYRASHTPVSAAVRSNLITDMLWKWSSADRVFVDHFIWSSRCSEYSFPHYLTRNKLFQLNIARIILRAVFALDKMFMWVEWLLIWNLRDEVNGCNRSRFNLTAMSRAPSVLLSKDLPDIEVSFIFLRVI